MNALEEPSLVETSTRRKSLPSLYQTKKHLRLSNREKDLHRQKLDVDFRPSKRRKP
jgi:hypothetical protein